ncbi:ATP-binding cassette domain-containing protein [Glaciihabitans arcticus]|uniref:ATP-binding cassette domain-containing protein n=1 Tax=Glaciihabitans arcticus TaxID=2668039 RepID=A0A4Q9GXI8_9MICO|nr:ATP-binding cassette domain-containing protein [Glaciihabitans arcticus]TBN57957.1 ATP-binding cassette domain-containing protein [Glaciihabitans arcticus]
MTDHALVAAGLHKRYGATAALDGFDLAIERGTIHGLLGPNGAGKSTAVRALATLVDYDDGTATIDGFDVRSQGAKVRQRIGLVGQSAAVDEILGGRQNLVMFGRLYGLSTRAATVRADELLERFGLSEAARKPVSGYSGGMRRRLDIAASLIQTPAVLFLDEPTTGLDPRGRNEVWEVVRRIRDEGTTVLLTTQYLDEADQLASRISVMNAGAVIAEGAPAELKREVGRDVLVVVVTDGGRVHEASTILDRVGDGPVSIDPDERQVSVPARGGSAALVGALRELDARRIEVEDIALRRPTLDEVFLTLTAPEVHA